jgi:hypothetical protein
MVRSKLIQKLDSATSTMFLFSLNNVSKFITHIFIPLKMIVQELIGTTQSVYSRENWKIITTNITVIVNSSTELQMLFYR